MGRLHATIDLYATYHDHWLHITVLFSTCSFTFMFLLQTISVMLQNFNVLTSSLELMDTVPLDINLTPKSSVDLVSSYLVTYIGFTHILHMCS